MTLHRIEKGTPSVTVGALMNVLDALDLPFSHLDAEQPAMIPVAIALAAYPQLRQLDLQRLEPHERQLIEALDQAFRRHHVPA